MHGTLAGMVYDGRTTARNPEIRTYARWEFGSGAEAWIVAGIPRRDHPAGTDGLRSRLRRWLRATRTLRAATAVARIEGRRHP